MCKDRRFYIKRNITGEHSTPTAEIQCQWSRNYNLNPMNFICEVKFCVNFTSAPADKNFNYTWDNNVVNINTNVSYPCNTNMAVENSLVLFKNQSLSYVDVVCNSSGEVEYPNEWPQCSSTVKCADPKSLSIPNEIYTTWPLGHDVEYADVVPWICKDRRYLIRPKNTDSTFGSIDSYCYWKKEYSHYPDQLECILTYCDNATEIPNLSHNYAFSWDGGVIHIDHDYHYPCKSGMKIENDTATKDEASGYSIVRCGSDGMICITEKRPGIIKVCF